jgi:tetratricopeptide (TPR) repeat protein
MIVKAWIEKVIIPTYGVGQPDKNPMFFEKRVYQGSSGVVYPNAVIEKIDDTKQDKEYNGVFLENKYIKVLILPEIGGRVQMAYDKIRKRHFIYYNQVIKPALVGLCGPWISGGIEFNWPQHHRPSTFDPVDFSIEEHKDGSKTIWVNEVEKMFHTKGMAGFTLYPDEAYLEINVKLFNRTPLPQTFLWWANPAVKVGDQYQSVFPPDVKAVFDHGKRDVSTFPIATGTYYKVDYSPGTDISMYKNIPVPTSYMAMNSEYDFVGGYEHDTRAGVLHIADHHVSPGKKQWTWGNGDFGVAWDRNLTDEDGPYIELMAGVFTDNQPDFTWLMPFEEKTFSQYFLPYSELGVVKNASKDLLLNADIKGDSINIKVFTTSEQKGLLVKLLNQGKVVWEDNMDCSPENPYENTFALREKPVIADLKLIVQNRKGVELLDMFFEEKTQNIIPQPAAPAKLPEQIDSPEQLFLTGQHLEQYRHATYSPVPYYERALKLDPFDARNNNALGLWLLRRGKFAESEIYFRNAINTLTNRNPNPYDCEPYFNLGLSLRYQEKIDAAYEAFFKASWSSAWQDAAYYFIAQIDFLRGDYKKCLNHIDWSLDRNARNNKAYIVKIQALRKLGRLKDAMDCSRYAVERDRFNLAALFEWHNCLVALKSDAEAEDILDVLLARSRGNAHSLIDYAVDYIASGLYCEAIELILNADQKGQSDPMLNYYIAYCWSEIGNRDMSSTYSLYAANADPSGCFPNRLEDIKVLKRAIDTSPENAKAAYFLGNLYYDKRQYAEAIDLWLLSASKDCHFPTVFRNLGIAFFNKRNEKDKSLGYFEKAFLLDQSDSRVLMELDQLYKRLNWSPAERLRFLNENLVAANSRDDIYLEIAALHNFIGDYRKAYELLSERKFHPWEGGEGKVSGQFIYALIEMAKLRLYEGHHTDAIKYLEEAQIYPDNLGEGKLPGTPENDIFYWLGCAQYQAGDIEKAGYYWERATLGQSEPSVAVFYNDQQPDKIFYQGLAWQKLNNEIRGDQIFSSLVVYGIKHINDDIKIDYFAVSLPDLAVFDDNLNSRNIVHCLYMQGLGFLGLKRYEESKSAFTEVLEKDQMHFGAKTHLMLLRKTLQNVKTA